MEQENGGGRAAWYMIGCTLTLVAVIVLVVVVAVVLLPMVADLGAGTPILGAG